MPKHIDYIQRVRKATPLRYSVHMPSSPSPTTSSPANGHLRTIVFAVLGAFGMAALWIFVALYLDRQCAWMAAIAAVDIVLLLRIGSAPAGTARTLSAILATLATIVMANWGIAASQIGLAVGLRVSDSLSRLGTDHAITLLELANEPREMIWYAIALFIAWWLGRRR